MTMTDKLIPIDNGLACATALLRPAMELRRRIHSAANAIAAKLGQCLNFNFPFTKALAAHIVSQDLSHKANSTADSGHFTDLMTRNHSAVEARRRFPAEPDLSSAAQKRHERELTEAKEQAEVAEAPIVDGPGEVGEAVMPLPGPGPVRSGVRILIAEDNLPNQMVIKHFLEMSGYRSDVANNGLEAIRAAETRAYDLVLMDISMPEMDGITAAAEIRDLARTWDTAPIIVAVTAHALPGDRKRFLAAGFDEVLVKPLHKRELLRGLSKWLSVAPPLPQTARGLNRS